ncbi:MAG: chromate transporter [Bryobacteraceae bacterium]
MNLLLLYLLLLKATATTFSGLGSLPIVRNDLVVQRGVLTDRELNTAVAAARTAPGPNGVYVVNVGYAVAGWPGAVAGWLAMVTPAFFIIAILKFLGRRAEHPPIRRVIRAVTLSSAGLLLAATVPLARDAITDPLQLFVAAATFALLAATDLDTIWMIVGAGAAGLARGLAAE